MSGSAEKIDGDPEREGQDQRDPGKAPGGEEFSGHRLGHADRQCQKQLDRSAPALLGPQPHRQRRDQDDVEPGMKGEEGLQIGLAALEEIADEEGQHPRHHEKDDDEHIGERRREIAGQLAAEDGQDVAHRCQAAAATGAGSGGAVVISRKTSSSRPRSTRRPVIVQPRSRARSAISATTGCPPRGKTMSPSPSRIADRLDRRHPGQRRQLGADMRIGAAGDAEANGVVMARALGELCRGSVGEDAAMSDDDRPAAHRLDLLEQMGRDDDRLLRPHRRDDLAHLVFLVGIEPVGRLVEDQHVGIVQQRLRDPDPALEALRQCFDRLMHDLARS